MGHIWQGILFGSGTGLLIAILLGPVFFVLLQTSIEKGFQIGLMFASGIIFSDSVIFLLAFLGISQFDPAHVDGLIGGIGGIVLFIMGIVLILKKPTENKDAQSIEVRGSLFRSFMKGFIVNMLNPSGIMAWIAIVGTIRANFNPGPAFITAFFITCMTIIFGTDVLKAFLAFRLKHMVTKTVMVWLNRISGIVLVGTAVKILYDAAKIYLVH